ncbi:MAG TPA: hypothetical protein PLV01_04015 [Candidatus Kapabacteria bacterium]|jgi:hypothetical protein|nr:hypothetical protein [Candidatus Kapabacteria bacterium]
MYKKIDILNFWGIGELKHLNIALPILIVSFAISIIPYEGRVMFINLLSLSCVPSAIILLVNERKSLAKKKIIIDKLIPFILVSNLDFVSVDEIRYIIFAVLYIILLNLPFIKYDFYKSRPIEIISKLSFAIVLSLFIAQIIALGILLLQISQYNK